MNNILILLPDQLKYPIGGMGEQARNIIKSFPSDYYFTIIGSSSCEEYNEDNFHYYPIMNIKTMHGNPEPFALTFLQQSLFIEKSLSLDYYPNIIHAFDWSSFWAGRILAKHYKAPLVSTMQLSIEKQIISPNPLQKLSYEMACSIEISGLLESDIIIQVSENYASLFHSFLLPKTTIIHNGINVNEWEQKNKIQLPGENPIKLIYIGRYAEMKNIQTLISCNVPDNIDLIFIGGPEGGNIELFNSMIEFTKTSSNIHFVGAKYGQEKIDWLCSADAVIVPSIHEPFGIVALEALASKSILLSSFVNGMSDFLTEGCAINCGITKESIENAIQKLITLTNEQKQSYINAGLKVCEEHKWSLQSEKLVNVYNSVITNK